METLREPLGLGATSPRAGSASLAFQVDAADGQAHEPRAAEQMGVARRQRLPLAVVEELEHVDLQAGFNGREGGQPLADFSPRLACPLPIRLAQRVLERLALL